MRTQVAPLITGVLLLLHLVAGQNCVQVSPYGTFCCCYGTCGPQLTIINDQVSCGCCPGECTPNCINPPLPPPPPPLPPPPPPPTLPPTPPPTTTAPPPPSRSFAQWMVWVVVASVVLAALLLGGTYYCIAGYNKQEYTTLK